MTAVRDAARDQAAERGDEHDTSAHGQAAQRGDAHAHAAHDHAAHDHAAHDHAASDHDAHGHAADEHAANGHDASGAALTPAERARLGRRAQLLAGASVSYNAVEAAIALTAGAVAGSGALIGFGLGSIVEVSSGLVILWQFRHALPQTREAQALRLIAVSFFALAGYVAQDSVRALLSGAEADPSSVGIALAATSLVVMPWLSWAQRRTGRALHSNAVVADSSQTLLCTYLSAVLLGGLVLNATLGWSWADPVAGLVIAAVAVKEGRDAWRGEGCCGPAPAAGALGRGEQGGSSGCCAS